MTSENTRLIFNLAKRILLLAFIYQLSRLVFFVLNFSVFKEVSPQEIAQAFLWGIRFDLSALFNINMIIVLLYLIILFLQNKSGLLKFTGTFFYIINIPFLLLNCIDLEYFKFQGKRTTADFFQLFTMGDDMKNTIPQMAIDFWYVIVIFILLSVLFVYLDKKIKFDTQKQSGSNLITKSLLALFIAVLSVITARGGMQYKPINIMSAARLTSPQLVPLVLNTPFTVIRTFGKTLIEEKKFMDQDKALTYFNKDHRFKSNEPFRPLNVVLIIMESFSAEYIGALNEGKGYTPFLDSLMNESLTFTNAYANAKKSIDGIPAVVASMPSLMPASYISTPYNSNKLNSIAGILAEKNYSSAFFHGGNNGTMNFDNFTRMTGFENYYGRREYPGQDYDGNWGIYDENFFDFFIDKCNEARQPFVNTFFSLSSHHPYSIPDHLKDRFPDGDLPIHKSIGYADYSLRHFFESARTTDWYDQTLFVITADHTGPASTAKFNTKSGMFRIPIVFYKPGSNLKGWSERVTQQTDIIPGILDYLHFDRPFSAFGNSMLDSTLVPFAINYPGDLYQILGDDYLVQFDGTEITGAFAYKTDFLLMKNIYSTENKDQVYLTELLKSFIQQYNSALIRNKLTPSN